jgi:hypothetical protein
MRGAATAGGACLAAGLVRASELSAGLIPHALFMGTECVATEYLPPASQQGDNRCVGPGPHVPFGAHIWLDLSKDQIEILHAMPWEKALLRALHDYGGFIMDAGGERQDHTGSVVGVELEDDA